MEGAGLGEAAFFLNKAKQQISYAQIALENIDQSHALDATVVRLNALIQGIGEAMFEIETSESELVEAAEEHEEKEADE